MSINHIGLSGLNAAEILLNNTAHNIANTETPGFSRRRPVLAAQQSHWGGLLNQLGGVRVLSLMRLSDAYLNDQVFRANASQGMADAFATPLSQLDQLLGGADTGLTDVLNGFMADLQRLETRPESVPLRQQWLGSAGQLVDRFQLLNQQLQEYARQQTEQIANTITEANRLTSAIAELNGQIIELSELGSNNGDDGNCADLLDQRDNLINELSAQLSVNVDRPGNNNAINLMIASRQGVIPLVSGSQNFILSISPVSPDPQTATVLANIPGTSVPILPQAGTLAGLQKLNTQGLVPAINQLGLMAVVLAAEVNSQLTSGTDLDGNDGTALFQAINSATAMTQRVVPEAVKGTGVLTVEIDNLSLINPSDYRLSFISKDECRVIRLTDGQSFSGPLTADTPFSVDGLSVHLTGTPDTNDQYLLTPWRNEVSQLTITLNNPDQLAFAAKGQGPGDNQNLLSLLGCLRGDSTACPSLLEKNTVLQSSIANQTASALRQQTTAESLYQSAVAERESLSGVNLDEEAANLLRFQQFYQANAQVLRTGQLIIDELLAVYR